MNQKLAGLTAVLSLCAALGMTGAPASAAEADTRPCVTKGEYKAIKKGNTLARVHDVFDTKGKVLFQNPGTVTNGAREYPTCKGSGLGSKVQVQYNNYAAQGGPFRVVHIDDY